MKKWQSVGFRPAQMTVHGDATGVWAVATVTPRWGTRLSSPARIMATSAESDLGIVTPSLQDLVFKKQPMVSGKQFSQMLLGGPVHCDQRSGEGLPCFAATRA
jgi:hypothetical protein